MYDIEPFKEFTIKGFTMPKVGNKKFPYTPKGKAAAKKAVQKIKK